MRARADREPTHTFLHRALWSTVAAGGASILLLASMLEPDSRGFGTHTQLGLPPCGFLAATGLPCAGCGMTTAFSYAIRGELSSSFGANPLGLVLFLAVCASIPLAIVGALRGWSVDDVLDRFRLGRWSLGIAVCAAAVWIARLAAA